MTNERKENMKIVECYHCGNKTYMDIVGKYTKDIPHYGYTEEIGEYITEEEEIEWQMLQCPVCEKITLLRTYWCSLHEEELIENILYPRFDYKKREVPEKINTAFIAALKSRHVDLSICLLSLRRTLEMICKDKGVEKGTLGKKLNKMVEMGIIPSVLDSASYIVKQLGNEAAHADDVIHTETDANNAIEFIEQIINYIYVLPARIKKIQSKED